MDAIGLAVAEVVPPDYQGVYRNADGLRAAESVLRDARNTTL
jgi:hypothetical protein